MFNMNQSDPGFQKAYQALQEVDIQSENVLRRIASTLDKPLRTQRDYVARARQDVIVDRLVRGVAAEYEKDFAVSAFVITDEGEAIAERVKGNRYIVETFEIVSQPKVTLNELERRRYNVLSSMQTKATNEIGRAEDNYMFQVRQRLTTNGFQDIPATMVPRLSLAGTLSVANLADVKGTIEANQLTASRAIVNPTIHADLLVQSNDVYSVTRLESLMNVGVVAQVFGINIVQTSQCPSDTSYVQCTPEYYGRMPVQRDLTMTPFVDNKKREAVFQATEAIGMALHNPYGHGVIDH